MIFAQTFAVVALAATASAHIRLQWPVPYSFATLDQAPLEAAAFPCKQRTNMYDITTMNDWNAGETKEISFLGSAVHGGGSCQFSLTTDLEPNAQTQWKVIESVIGGCVSNATGNLSPADADFAGGATFPVTLPKDLPSGQYTFAWTWMNKVGNREFYMNCAPIKVGGASSKRADAAAVLSPLPDMFVANIPSTSCSTTEGQDFNYPNPGENVIKGAGAALGNDLVGSGCDAMTVLGAGSGQMGSPSQPTGSPSEPSEAPATSAAAPSATNPGGVFAPGASSAAPVASAPAATSAASPPAATSAVSPPKGTGAPSAPSSGDCTPCETDGAVVCIGSKQFGLCNRGCAVAQDLALGMSCSNGSITRRSIRHFPRAHLHRRHGSNMI